MAWIGLVDLERRRSTRHASPVGLVPPVREASVPMPSGTVLVEATLPAGPEPVNLLRLATPLMGLTLRLGPREVALFLRRGPRSESAVLSLPAGRPGDAVRITVAWADGTGRLSAWLPEAPAFAAASLPVGAGALSRDEALVLLVDLPRRAGPHDPAAGPAAGFSAGQALATPLSLLACADHALPGGPLPGLDGTAPVTTPSGDRPLAALRAGDLALGPDGTAVRLVWAGSLLLPAAGLLAPRRLPAPRLSLGHDLEAAAEQALLIEGGDVEYLFGAERVAVAARDLGSAVPSGPLRLWSGVATEDGAAVLVAGMAVATIAARPLLADVDARAASVLVGMEPLPRRAGAWIESWTGDAAVPRLSAVEARALRFHRAA